jgi:archaellum component FlaC
MVEALVSYTELINSDAQNFNERLRETLEKKLEARREEIEKEREEYQRVEAFVQGYNKLRWA